MRLFSQPITELSQITISYNRLDKRVPVKNKVCIEVMCMILRYDREDVV